MSSIYKTYDPGQVFELQGNYMIDSWSYSKVSEFSRNEKSFEMTHIYGHRHKSSASSVAGVAYHKALQFYFTERQKGIVADIADLEVIAFDHIETIGADKWKIQKTLPTVMDCKLHALKLVGQLLKNFFGEIGIYIDEIEEILGVELFFEEWLTINGVDIPMLCHGVCDLIVKTKKQKIAVIDHKSKGQFTDQQELKLAMGPQVITYAKCYEENTGLRVDEVWIIENKYSANRDKAPQLNCFKVELTDDVRRLYEALLYEPLRRMLEAVSNPDYVYLINPNDNFVDQAEIYEFWSKTMIAEVHEFNIRESKKDLIENRLKKIRDSSVKMVDPKVIREFQANAAQFIQYDLSNKNMTPQEKIEHVLRSFGIITRVAHTLDGYSSNTYLLEISAGQKIQSVHSHSLDIANVLDVASVRITKNLVVYENKSYISIETSKKRERDLIFDPKALNGMNIPLGIDNYGRVIYWDLENHSTPHALVCGATGSGKSVCIKSVLEYCKLAGINDIMIMDPKHEFKKYNEGNISVYNDIEEIETVMEILVEKMQSLAKSSGGNAIYKTFIIFDEFADAVANSRKGAELKVYEMVEDGINSKGEVRYKRKQVGEKKSLEENMRILLQKGRSLGFRIMAATQRASVKVITGDAKVNFPVQICFRVPKAVDSKVVIDEEGAESLAGGGDALMRSPDYQDLVRFQSYFKP